MRSVLRVPTACQDVAGGRADRQDVGGAAVTATIARAAAVMARVSSRVGRAGTVARESVGNGESKGTEKVWGKEKSWVGGYGGGLG